MRYLPTALAVLAASPAAAQTIDAPARQVSGTTEADIRVFKGVLYAQPPVGARRWQAPAPLPRWPGVRRATAFGPACIQPTSTTPSVYSPRAPLPTSEDCLSLNIWSPKNAARITTPDLKRSVYGLPSGEAAGQAVAAAMKAPDLAALRALDAQKLTDDALAAGFQPWSLIDGTTLPEQLVEAFDARRQARVPILAGYNQGEIRSLRMLAPPAPPRPGAGQVRVRYDGGETCVEINLGGDLSPDMVVRLSGRVPLTARDFRLSLLA